MDEHCYFHGRLQVLHFLCNMKINDTGSPASKCHVRMRETMNIKTSREVCGTKKIESVTICLIQLRTFYSFFPPEIHFGIYGVLLCFRLYASYFTLVVSLDPNNIVIIIPILQIRHQTFEMLNLKTLLKVPQAA